MEDFHAIFLAVLHEINKLSNFLMYKLLLDFNTYMIFQKLEPLLSFPSHPWNIQHNTQIKLDKGISQE